MKFLLQVEDTFLLSGRGLLIVPALQVLPGFAEFNGSVEIEPPGAPPFVTEAKFSVIHFSPRGYRVVVLFKDLEKEAIPVGSRVLVAPSVLEALHVDGSPR